MAAGFLGKVPGDEVVPLHPAGERGLRVGGAAEHLGDERPALGIDLPAERGGCDQPQSPVVCRGERRDPPGEEPGAFGEHGAGQVAEVGEDHLHLVLVEAEQLRGLLVGGLRPQLFHRRVHQAVEVGMPHGIRPAAVGLEMIVAGVEGEAELLGETASHRRLPRAGGTPEPEYAHGERIPAVSPRFLVHQARFHVGDTLWLTPLLRALHRFFPGARVTVVAPPVARELFAGNPHVQEVVPYRPTPGGERAARRSVLDALAGHSFDAALFAFARRPESRWLAKALAAAGVPRRINLEYVDSTLERAVPPWLTEEAWFVWGAQPSPKMLLHALDPLLGPGRPEWMEADRRVELYVPAEARRRAAELLVERGLGDEPFAILAPGGHSSLRWPARSFARLAAHLAAEGLPVLVEGSPGEQGLLERVAEAAAPRVTAAADPLPVYAALLERARLLVANDSASIHLAEAMGTPTVYFAQREKLIHSHPAGDRCRALCDEEENRPSRIPLRRALAVAREMLGG